MNWLVSLAKHLTKSFLLKQQGYRVLVVKQFDSNISFETVIFNSKTKTMEILLIKSRFFYKYRGHDATRVDSSTDEFIVLLDFSPMHII